VICSGGLFGNAVVHEYWDSRLSGCGKHSSYGVEQVNSRQAIDRRHQHWHTPACGEQEMIVSGLRTARITYLLPICSCLLFGVPGEDAALKRALMGYINFTNRFNELRRKVEIARGV